MKRMLSVACAALLLFALFPAVSADSGFMRGPPPEPAFVLPASLQYIEEEAFLGISARSVRFQSGLLRIQDNAFARAGELMDVYIPASVQYIADTAFASAGRFIIHGAEDSYAQTWADAHHIPFAAENEGTVPPPPPARPDGEPPARDSIDPKTIKEPYGGTEDREISMRPQDRPELNPIDYRFP